MLLHQVEDLRDLPASDPDRCMTLLRQDSREVVGQTATGDVRHRPQARVRQNLPHCRPVGAVGGQQQPTYRFLGDGTWNSLVECHPELFEKDMTGE